MAQRADPYAAFNFVVEIDGITVAGFSEVSGLGVAVDTIEYREGSDPALSPRKLPGLARYSNVALRRGYSESTDLWQWQKAVLDGQVERKAVAVTLLDEARQPVRRFQLRRAWPCRYEGPHLDAASSEVAIEVLEICHEGLEIE